MKADIHPPHALDMQWPSDISVILSRNYYARAWQSCAMRVNTDPVFVMQCCRLWRYHVCTVCSLLSSRVAKRPSLHGDCATPSASLPDVVERHGIETLPTLLSQILDQSSLPVYLLPVVSIVVCCDVRESALALSQAWAYACSRPVLQTTQCREICTLGLCLIVQVARGLHRVAGSCTYCTEVIELISTDHSNTKCALAANNAFADSLPPLPH
jgi:hypothetical protein